jgi:soluble lytic murein transglycosylase
MQAALKSAVVTLVASASLVALSLAGPVQAQPVNADRTTPTASLPAVGVRPSGPNYAGLDALKTIAEHYQRGDFAAGDTAAAQIMDADIKVAAEWVAIRTSPRSLGFERVSRFADQNPDLAGQRWLRRKTEDALVVHRVKPDQVLAYYHGRQPETANGRTALAIALFAKGRTAEAAPVALAAYRDRLIAKDAAAWLEQTMPQVITSEERVLRAHRLIQQGQHGEGFRIAGTVNADHLRLAQALAHAEDDGKSTQVLDAVPESLRNHPSFLLARAQIMRRTGNLEAARDAMIRAPRAHALLGDPDEWWTERRVLARKLMDAGDGAGAFRVAAEHDARSPGRRAEAEFHAGWIALTVLRYPQTAELHFRASFQIAESNAARSRALFWSARAREAGAIGDAQEAYAAAGAFPATYHGQLALARLGREIIQTPSEENWDASTLDASPTGRVVARLLAAGLNQHALPLAIELGRFGTDPVEIDAVADLFAAQNNAPAVLSIGRGAVDRGLPVMQHGFPTFGIPKFEPLPGSQDAAMVYAIARQESAFNPKAMSHVGARGLMQFMPATAARTARRFNQPYHVNMLTDNPTFNAMLGAAHLGELMEETKGSIVMTFASYNAGGRRVREWVEAYGDPRKPGVDVVEWVERIPIYETRHYVQKVMENLQVYRARMQGNFAVLRINEDMLSGRRDDLSVREP